MTTSLVAASADTAVSAAHFETTHPERNPLWGHLLPPASTAPTEEQIDGREARCPRSPERFPTSGMQGNYLPDDLEVDSVWHAHQCDPAGYAKFRTQYFGGGLAHTVSLCVGTLVDLDQK